MLESITNAIDSNKIFEMIDFGGIDRDQENSLTDLKDNFGV